MRKYDRVSIAARNCRYNEHAICPRMILPSRTAWALAYEAERRRLMVADLITEIVAAWGEAWEQQLGETDRRRYVQSIPYHRGPYVPRQPHVADASAREESLPW